MTIFRESELAHRYCLGRGIEIGGSAHNPFGLDTRNVDITDATDTRYKLSEIEMCGSALPVDIVAPGDQLPLDDNSQDFVVSSHVLEHFSDPVGALLEWYRVVRPGGVIFMIVPHKERTFDSVRPRTPLSHLVEDHMADVPAPHLETTEEHNHVWMTEDLVELVEWMTSDLGVAWELLEVQDVDDKVGNGFTIVLRKNAASG